MIVMRNVRVETRNSESESRCAYIMKCEAKKNETKTHNRYSINERERTSPHVNRTRDITNGWKLYGNGPKLCKSIKYPSWWQFQIFVLPELSGRRALIGIDSEAFSP